MESDSIARDDWRIEHNVGLDYDYDTGIAPVKCTLYDANSTLADDAANAVEVDEILETYLPGKISTVMNKFQQQPSLTEYTWNDWLYSHNQETRIIKYGPHGQPEWVDINMAIGTAEVNWTFRVTVGHDSYSNRAWVKHLYVVGTLDDTYDFEYKWNPRECQIQAGYPTLGGAGMVYTTHIDMDTENDSAVGFTWTW